MTPTEQDNELREKINSLFESVFSQGVRARKDVATETYEDYDAWRKGGEIDEIMQLITDYTNKQIEAVLDRLELSMRGKTLVDTAEGWQKFVKRHVVASIEAERNKLNRRKYEGI